jgi:hypothetical protein
MTRGEASRTAYDMFREVVGLPLATATITATVQAHGAEAVRSAVSRRDKSELRRMLRISSATPLGQRLCDHPERDSVASRVGQSRGDPTLRAPSNVNPPQNAPLLPSVSQSALHFDGPVAPAAETVHAKAPTQTASLDFCAPAAQEVVASAGPRPARRPPDPPPGTHMAAVSRPRVAAMAPPADPHADHHGGHTAPRLVRSNGNDSAMQAHREYDEVTVYGRDMGLALQRSPMKPKDRQADRPRTMGGPTTINFRIAKAKGVRALDGLHWGGAIQIMLMPQELVLSLGVMLGLLPKYRAAGHGEFHDKWYELEEIADEGYAGQIKVTIAQGKGAARDLRRVNITPADSSQTISIFFRAVESQLRIAGHELMTTIRRTCDLWAKSPEGRKVLERTPTRRLAYGSGQAEQA